MTHLYKGDGGDPLPWATPVRTSALTSVRWDRRGRDNAWSPPDRRTANRDARVAPRDMRCHFAEDDRVYRLRRSDIGDIGEQGGWLRGGYPLLKKIFMTPPNTQNDPHPLRNGF